MGLCINFQFKLSTCPFPFQVPSPFIFSCCENINLMDNPVQLRLSSPMQHHHGAWNAAAGSSFCRLCPWALQDPPHQPLSAGPLSFADPHPQCAGSHWPLCSTASWMTHHMLIVNWRSSSRLSQAGLFHIPVPIQSFITNSMSPAKISRWKHQPQSLIGSAAAPHIFHIFQLKIILSEMCPMLGWHPQNLCPKPASVLLQHYSNMWSASRLSLQETFPLAIFLCGRAQLIQTHRKMLLNLFQTSRCVGVFRNSALSFWPLSFFFFYSTTHLLKIYSWLNVKDHFYSK